MTMTESKSHCPKVKTIYLAHAISHIAEKKLLPGDRYWGNVQSTVGCVDICKENEIYTISALVNSQTNPERCKIFPHTPYQLARSRPRIRLCWVRFVLCHAGHKAIDVTNVSEWSRIPWCSRGGEACALGSNVVGVTLFVVSIYNCIWWVFR